MKVVAVLRDPPLPDLDGVSAAIFEVVEGDGYAVVCGWGDEPLRDVEERWVVDERRQWSDRDPDLVRFAFVRALPALTRAEFGEHWTTVHAPLARRHHPALVAYVQNVVVDGPDPTDGIAELGLADGAPMYSDEEGRAAVAADLATFLDVPQGWRLLTRPVRRASRP
jgi:hypothetical protein